MVDGNGEGGKYVDAAQGVKDSYNKGVTDEFVIPFVCIDNQGESLGTIRAEDSWRPRGDRLIISEFESPYTQDTLLNRNGNAEG